MGHANMLESEDTLASDLIKKGDVSKEGIVLTLDLQSSA